MAQKKDYYETLGINKTATPEEIKKAYRQLAKKYHPDINHDADAPEKFKEITEAYECLSDPKKKSMYDQYGFAGVDPNGAGGFGGQSANFSEGDFGDLGDIFSQFFGGGSSSRSRARDNTPRKGQDRGVRINLSFDQAVNGTKVDIPLEYVKACPDCNGTGARSASDVETCPTCRGMGRVRARRQTLFGTMETEEACPDCNGTGKRIRVKCPHCHGAGRVKVNETITVNVPHGVDTDDNIRISGKGNPGVNGGPNGDLIIQIAVSASQTFTRKGADVYVSVPISVSDALLGATVSVPSVKGECDLVIPPCTEPDIILKMANQGITLPSGKTGNQYVTIKVKFPKNLNSAQKEAITKFDEEENKKDGGVFSWLKHKFRTK